MTAVERLVVERLDELDKIISRATAEYEELTNWISRTQAEPVTCVFDEKMHVKEKE